MYTRSEIRLTCRIQSRVQSWGVMVTALSWAQRGWQSAKRWYTTRAAFNILLQRARHCPNVSPRPQPHKHTHTGLAGPSQGRNRLSKLSWWRARLVTGPCQEWRETVRGVVSWGYGWRLTVHVLTVTLPDELTFCAVGAGGMWQVRLSN